MRPKQSTDVEGDKKEIFGGKESCVGALSLWVVGTSMDAWAGVVLCHWKQTISEALCELILKKENFFPLIG